MTNCDYVCDVMKINRHALTALRERSGATKAELAQLAGVDRTLITRIENGERPATPAVIARLAAALQVSQLALVLGEDEVA